MQEIECSTDYHYVCYFVWILIYCEIIYLQFTSILKTVVSDNFVFDAFSNTSVLSFLKHKKLQKNRKDVKKWRYQNILEQKKIEN